MSSTDFAPLDSFSTALVLLPPAHVQTQLNSLRAPNDKSYPRWTAHITLLYPFVHPSHLQSAVRAIRSHVSAACLSPFTLTFDHVDYFQTKHYDTFHLAPNTSSRQNLQNLWSVLSCAAAYSGRSFAPHLTLGQSHRLPNESDLLRAKADLLLQRANLSWEVHSVVVLIKNEACGGRMQIFDHILLQSGPQLPFPAPHIVSEAPPTYRFNSISKTWVPLHDISPVSAPTLPRDLKIITFNILHDSDHPCLTRYQKIRSTLIQLDGDVVCLQEVTDDFLFKLLTDDLIQSKWSWSTQGCDTVMGSQRNVVVLTKHHIPFSWNKLTLGGKHKVASILTIPSQTFSLGSSTTERTIIAAVHLTAGFSSEQQEAKSRELDTLVRELRNNYPEDSWIIAGDFNFIQSQNLSALCDAAFQDAWTECYDASPDRLSATYDPSRNVLAALTARSDKSPQRYDRILIKRHGLWHPQDASVFADLSGNSGPVSDHWPLAVVLSQRLSPPIPEQTDRYDHGPQLIWSDPNEEYAETASVQGKDAELLSYAHEADIIPSDAQRLQKETAVEVLRSLIHASLDASTLSIKSTTENVSSGPSPVRFIIVPVGSLAMGTDFPSSDVDCLVVGNVSSPAFWSLAKHKLLNQSGDRDARQIRLRRFVKDAAVKMMLLEYDGISMDLQYCPSSLVVERWAELNQNGFDVNLPMSAMRTLNAHRDRLKIFSVIPPSSLATFRLTCRLLKLFCLNHGILASRFGFLSNIHIAIMLSSVFRTVSPDITAMDLLKTFFRYYSSFDWAQETVRLLPDQKYNRKSNEPMVILSPERPAINVAGKAGVNTLEVVRRELTLAHKRLCEGIGWPDVSATKEDCFKTFLKSSPSFLRVDIRYWGGSCLKARAYLGFVESKLVSLLVDLRKAAPTAIGHLWPSLLASEGPSEPEASSHIDGFYLISLQYSDDSAALTDGHITVQTALQAFERDISQNDKYFDSAQTFISASECKRESIGPSWTPITLRWNDGGFDEDAALDEVDEIDEVLDSVPENPEFVSNSQLKKQKQVDRKKSPLPNSGTNAKLRTSADTYNRLMWDPQYRRDDYMIGYEDRFVGIMELPLLEWKREVEDESFIPFHRVVHFRRKSDGEVIWNRNTKLDKVFGSGEYTS